MGEQEYMPLAQKFKICCHVESLSDDAAAILLVVLYVDFFQTGISKSLRVGVPLQKLNTF